MARVIVVTTSYPRAAGDAEGHFVAAEVQRLCQHAEVSVLAPGEARPSLFGEQVVSLGGGDAFGFPGALSRLREQSLRALPALKFSASAARRLRRESRSASQVIAHFLLPCAFPIATLALRGRSAALEVVVHGSDGRLFAALPAGKPFIARQLLAARATLRFVSEQLRELVLGSLPEREGELLCARSRVEPCALDVSGTPSKTDARRQLGIPDDSRLALIVARLVPQKRVELALSACSLLPALSCVVVGEGPERARLELEFPKARFVGQLPRAGALRYIAAADVLLCASRDEGAPSVVREARALGTPVVSVAAGDLARWAESDAGLLVV